MVTGYTVKMADGEVSFGDFVMNCARAFTAGDGPIPDQWKVDPYHREEIAKAKKGIRRVKDFSEKECEIEARKWLRDMVEQNNEVKKKTQALRGRLMAMKARVESWAPPTEDHRPLKKFMLNQLALSISRGGDFNPELPETYSGEEWRRDALEEFERDLEYHVKELEEEVVRVAKMNRWITALRRSLKGV